MSDSSGKFPPKNHGFPTMSLRAKVYYTRPEFLTVEQASNLIQELLVTHSSNATIAFVNASCLSSWLYIL